MEHMRTVQTTRQVVDRITCDRCGKTICTLDDRGYPKCEVVPGEPVNADESPLLEVVQIHHKWGYFSNKDQEEHRIDLCERCYDELLAPYARVSEYQIWS